jgi:hypothetical protein
MNPNYSSYPRLLLADEAGPLWLALESFLESLPVWPKWIFLAGPAVLVIAALAFVVASFKRRK